MRLSQATLDELPIPYPAYDRPNVRAGIAHIGVGGFHRAHETVYIDRLLTRGSTGWGITGIGVMPGDAALRDALTCQDHLYTLSVRHPDGRVVDHVVGAITGYVLAADDPEAAIEALADPLVRIVSLTITEGGYFTDSTTGEFSTDHPSIVADLATPGRPSTAFGLIVEALRRRRARGDGPFTVMSCDNIQNNGAHARRGVLGYARALERGSSRVTAREAGLADWIEGHVTFPNSMVDRITPVTTAADAAALRDRAGIEDAWPVVCEPFSQWVLEDSFAAGRPPFEDVGVQLVADITPYEQLKLRLLDAAHQTIIHAGALLGYEFVDQALGDPVVVGLVRAYHAEAIPTLAKAPGIDPAKYGNTVIERLSNAGIRDAVARNRDGSGGGVLFVAPVIRDNLAAGREIRVAALVMALWAVSVRGRMTVGPETLGDLANDSTFGAAFGFAIDALQGDGGITAGIRTVLAHVAVQ